ncbi:hypothetical protein [Nitrosomonas marina]|uniref:Uncharacterized protein n=1 Tax=Nitrosomonas marina TaxID=917 RepID=A0A1H8CCR0_9PROT|nr:hypothetical protein [Nitrosomonas marina]SEM92873.1 hypothetical protein SAMN05216325_104143 [Nitrosomonas marina]
MKRLIAKCHILIIPVLFFVIHADNVKGKLSEENAIKNLKIESVSNRELKFTVDYAYNGKSGISNVYIHAIPVERDGVFDPRTVDYVEVPLKRGVNSETLRITKRAHGRNFTSETIRVCMSTQKEAILCKDFPYIKKWSEGNLCKVTLITPDDNGTLNQQRLSDGRVETAWRFSWSECPGATKYHLYVVGPETMNPLVDINILEAPMYLARSTHYGITSLKGWTWKVRAYVNGKWGDWSESRAFNVSPVGIPESTNTCAISGQLTGKLQDHGFAVTHVGVFVPGESKPKSVAELDNRRRYIFQKLPGNVEYRIAPFGRSAAGWRFDRQKAHVLCQAGGSHTVNIHVQGVLMD